MKTKEKLKEANKALTTIKSILSNWNKNGKYSNEIEYINNIQQKTV